jgi:ribosomal protein S10
MLHNEPIKTDSFRSYPFNIEFESTDLTQIVSITNIFKKMLVDLNVKYKGPKSTKSGCKTFKLQPIARSQTEGAFENVLVHRRVFNILSLTSEQLFYLSEFPSSGCVNVRITIDSPS